MPSFSMEPRGQVRLQDVKSEVKDESLSGELEYIWPTAKFGLDVNASKQLFQDLGCFGSGGKGGGLLASREAATTSRVSTDSVALDPSIVENYKNKISGNPSK